METTRAYNVFSQVIEKGFDYIGVTIRGTPFVIKTISPQELELIRLRSNGLGSFVFRIFRMAYATYMHNGVDCLQDRETSLNKLVVMYMNMYIDEFEILEELAIKLQNRYKRYFHLVEGFFYSRKSRLLWKTHSTGIRSVPYAFTGLYEITEAWGLVNQSVDDEEEYNLIMAPAYLTASAQDPKGIKKVINKKEGANKLRNDERESLIKYGSKANRIFELEGQKSKLKDRWTSDISTAEGLVSELNREMRGEKDKHDLFVEDYMNKVRESISKAQKVREEKLAKIREERNSRPEVEGSFALSSSEIKKIESGEVKLLDVIKEKAKKAEIKDKPLFENGKISTIGKKVLRPRNVVRSK